MEEQSATIPEIQEVKRPALLTVACILTMIWSGLWAFIFLIGVIASGWIGSLIEGYVPGLGNLGGMVIIIVCLVAFIFFGLSLWGAIKMIGLKKSGFILYVIPNGLMLIGQLGGIFTAYSLGSLIYLLVSIGFIVIYALNLKNMK